MVENSIKTSEEIASAVTQYIETIKPLGLVNEIILATDMGKVRAYVINVGSRLEQHLLN